MTDIILYDYWRSSSAYRVRIALNLKDVAYEARQTNLLEDQQMTPEHLALNPQGKVPVLSIDGHDLIQSVPIMEYLDHKFPEPTLFPSDFLERTAVMAQLLIIVAEIQPVQNLRVLKHLRSEFGADDAAVAKWIRHWITDGFEALEKLAPEAGFFGGNTPNVVDICLVPQMYNARRYRTDLGAFPKLVQIDVACNELEAFQKAAPEAVKSAE